MNNDSKAAREFSKFWIAMGALVFLGLVLFLGFGIYFLFFSATATRFDKPLTYAEASTNKDIDFPFPQSSHDIYYGFYADWQAYTLLLAFRPRFRIVSAKLTPSLPGIIRFIIAHRHIRASRLQMSRLREPVGSTRHHGLLRRL